MRRVNGIHHVVQQSFRNEDELAAIPSGYIDLLSGENAGSIIFLREALECVRRNNLIHRWRIPTFHTNRRDLEDMPMLKTMRFAPWAAFSIPRRVPNMNPVVTTGAVSRRFQVAFTSEWTEYFCFSREDDLAMFRLVWA